MKNRPGGEAVAAQPEGFTQTIMDGQRRRVYWASSPLTGWKVVLNISEDDILAPIRELMVRALIGLAGLVILVLVVTAIARRLGQPLLGTHQRGFRHRAGSIPRGHWAACRNVATNWAGWRAVSRRWPATSVLAKKSGGIESESGENRVGSHRRIDHPRHGAGKAFPRSPGARHAGDGVVSAELEPARQSDGGAGGRARAGGAIEFLAAPMGALFVMGKDGILYRQAAHAYPESAGLQNASRSAVASSAVAQSQNRSSPSRTGKAPRAVRLWRAEVPRRSPPIRSSPMTRPSASPELCLFKPLTETQTRWLEKATESLANALRFALESERRQAEERNRLITESSAEGIFGTDTEGRITFVNSAACRMLGFTAAELMGQPSHAAFHHHHPDGREYPKEECPMYAAYTQGKASRIDDELLWRKDGTGLPVEYGATPIVKDGVVVGSVVSFTDITERKRAEQRLRETEQFSAACWNWRLMV